MERTNVQELFPTIDNGLSPQEYNYAKFRTKHLLLQKKRMSEIHGILPGEAAPKFELLTTAGSPISLSNYHGQPILLTFGSYT